MTVRDKWIAGVSFIFVLLFMAVLLFGSIHIAFLNKWYILLIPISMSINLVLTVLIMPYMRTWQGWADNIKKLVG